MKKVLLIQPILSHYRQSLFELLTSESNIDIEIMAGEELNEIQVFESKSKKITSGLKNYKFKIRGHYFYFQKGIFSAIKKHKPTNIILGGPDFHFISTVVVSIYLLLFTKVKVHYWTHGLSKSNSGLLFNLASFFYSKATSIFTYEEDGKTDLVLKMNIDKNKIIVVKNCLNDWDYGFNNGISENKNGNSVLNILFSGRLTRAKRLDTLIMAIKILLEQNIPIKCNIIGDGDMKMELENLVDNLGMNEAVKFNGALYKEDVEKFFRASDVFVLPGKVGLSIIHALSYGLPIVTTSLPIHSPEFAILKKNQNAFFFNGQTSGELAKTLLSFYNSRGIKENIKNLCIKSVIDNGYTPKGMKAKFLKGLG